MPQIERFNIIGLFGEKDISIDFSDPVRILIADNGIGKTTILGIIYAVLSGTYTRLRRAEFHNIEVWFTDGSKVEIPRSIIDPNFDIRRKDPRFRRLIQQIPEAVLADLHMATSGMSYSEFIRNPQVREISRFADFSGRYLYDILASSLRGEQLELLEFTDSPEAIRSSIEAAFPYKTHYFPTYRRIEEDLERLGYERKERFRSEGLIQFGMDDVALKINEVTDQIKKSSVAWYSRINGQMLSQLVDGFKLDDPSLRAINIEALKIVLDRIGDNISHNHKARIMGLVATGEINDGTHDYLAYFLTNLVKIYDQQKDQDNAIKEFSNVCNRYLVDKSIVYDESDVEIGVYSTTSGRSIKLSDLSSGEKQIISLFSRLYLDKREPVALLFDEPELSLSIEWQRMLLPDIIKTGNCGFLMATTHSPFIFENELDQYARDLREFTTQTRLEVVE